MWWTFEIILKRSDYEENYRIIYYMKDQIWIISIQTDDNMRIDSKGFHTL